MSDDLDRARIKRATPEGDVRPRGLPLSSSCRHCDGSFPTIYPRERQIQFNHSHLKVVR